MPSSRDSQYLRSPVEFLDRTDVCEIIKTIADSKSLTIYCGAGVTIDKTNMGWGQVISAAYGSKEDEWRYYPTSNEIQILQANSDPMQLATILQRYLLDHFGDEEQLLDHIAANLRNGFYGSNDWLSGGLARNVAFLALMKAFAGVDVKIVTTNYEEHTQKAVTQRKGPFQEHLALHGKRILIRREYLRRIQEADGPKYVFDNTKAANEEEEEGEVHATITFTYLHGCLAPSGLVKNSALVLSEPDYTVYRSTVEKKLKKLLESEDTVLFVGTSMTDPPLISTLIHTRADKSRKRFALLPLERDIYQGHDEETALKIIGHRKNRGTALGVTFLMPDFRYEVSQFIEEVTHYAMHNIENGVASHATSNKQRLIHWWQDWQKSPQAMDESILHAHLQHAMNRIREFITHHHPSHEWDLDSRERFKLELWVREAPQTNRHLTKWAASNAIITDRDSLSQREIQLGSRIAAVQTFAEGRPQHLDFTDLTRGEISSTSAERWGSYYSVPIFLGGICPEGWETLKFNARTLVGVITLASTRSRKNSALPLQASKMLGIKELMIEYGRLALDPHSDITVEHV